MANETINEAAKAMGPLLDKRAQILDDGCWIVPGGTMASMKNGTLSCKYNRKQYPIHRVMWIHYKGDTGGMAVQHSCSRRGCINPEHMYLVKRGNPNWITGSTNVGRGHEKNKPPVVESIPTPTPVVEPEPVLKPHVPHTARLSDDEIQEIKNLLRLMRGIRAYMNGTHRA